MNRNLNKPVVAAQGDPVRILETQPMGSVIATVNANDADRRVCHRMLHYRSNLFDEFVEIILLTR